MRLSTEQRDAVVDHARAEHPNECCGVVAVRDGTAVAVHRLENLAASPFRFEVDGFALHRLLTEIEDAGVELQRHLPLAHALGALSVADRRELRRRIGPASSG